HPCSAASSVPSFTVLCPPASALFPYTTLFRSALRRPALRTGRQRRHGGAGAGARLTATVPIPVVADPGLARAGRGVPARRAAGADRKSTRLNSSHVKISYAVFCLKQNTKRITA